MRIKDRQLAVFILTALVEGGQDIRCTVPMVGEEWYMDSLYMSRKILMRGQITHKPRIRRTKDKTEVEAEAVFYCDPGHIEFCPVPQV